MEINMKINAGSITAATHAKRGGPKPLSPGGGDSFASSNALEGALKSVPDVRPEAVARAPVDQRPQLSLRRHGEAALGLPGRQAAVQRTVTQLFFQWHTAIIPGSR